MRARQYLSGLHDFRIAPTSVTMASLVDFLCEGAHRIIQKYPPPALDFNSATFFADDWSAFMHTWDVELVGGLTQFYDVHQYERWRHAKQIKIKIERPQLNILAGATPQDLLTSMPANVWGQGFMSRVVMIFSNERFITDDFASKNRELDDDLKHDLNLIYNLEGQFEVSKEYRELAYEWRQAGEGPKPQHPKLEHYNTRRRAQVYKLSMVHAVDKNDSLRLTATDFKAAVAWINEAELGMEKIFNVAATVDAQLQDEVVAWLRGKGSVTQTQLVHKASRLFPGYAVLKVIDLMVYAGRIAKDEDGIWTANDDPV